MNTVFARLGLTPLWGWILTGVAVLILADLILHLVRIRLFKNRLKKALESSSALKAFKKRYPPEALLRRSGRMEAYARIWGKGVIQETGLAPLWTERLDRKGRARDMRRVLAFCPEQDKFKAFLAGQKKHRLQTLFLSWVTEEGEDHTLRILATSCRGEEFDGVAALGVIGEHLDSLREMTGDPEWYSRYFAYRILLHDGDPKSIRSSWDGFQDSHPLIRKTLAEKFASSEREKLYKQLWNLVLQDPIYEVRRSAKMRILADFADLYNPETEKLSGEGAQRVLQLLEESSSQDRNTALKFLEDNDLELRYPAALFLEKCGILDRMLQESSLDDRTDLQRTGHLLQMAVEVNVTSFLSRISAASPTAALLIAARLLHTTGNRENLTPVAREIFRFFSDNELTADLKEIYQTTLAGISARGDDAALALMRGELETRQNSLSHLELLLPAIPPRGDALFLPLLVRFLKSETFPARDLLIDTMKNLPADLVLPPIFEILDGSRKMYTHQVRISALKLLGFMKVPYCLQRILESLPILPQEEARDFARILNEYPKALFEEKVGRLLKTPDGQIRAALLAVLPATGNRSFMKEIRDSLKDADPEVRIAAIWSLLEFGEIRLLNQETSMLRDPVERVRVATARVIGQQGNAAALEVLSKILKDENEVEPVKQAAIIGLGRSEASQSTEILCEVLDSQENFREETIRALAGKTTARELTRLIEIFKDASPALREKIVVVFQSQEEEAEGAILELLKTDVSSLKPYIAGILEGTGYIEKTIRKLSHRNAEIRREAALWLSLLETKSAFRGIVLAAKDPDQEVRVLVVKALEKLNSKAGKAILEELKEDPDRRIRRYTLWAMERLTSLSME